MKQFRITIGMAFLFVLPACSGKGGSTPAAEDNATSARFEDAPFAKGPQVAEPYAVSSQSAYDLVYDPYRGRVFATFNGSDSGVLARINPATGEIDGQLRIEGEAGPLALAPDGSRLWVGVRNRTLSGLCRVDPDAMTASPPKPLDPDRPKDAIAATLVILPGTRNSVVASIVGTTRPTVAVFDDGVLRPEFVAKIICSNVVSSSDGETYFAFNNMSTGFELQELKVSQGGIRHVESYPDVFDGFDAQAFLAVGGGRIFGRLTGGGAGGGKVFDIPTRKVIRDLPPFNAVAIDEKTKRLFLLNLAEGGISTVNSNCRVTVRNLDDYEVKAEYAVPPKVRTVDGVTFPRDPKGDPTWFRHYTATSRRAILLGETTLAVNNYGITFVPVNEILKGKK